MGTFTNDTTGVTFSVADEKDDRYVTGHTAAKAAPAKDAPKRSSKSSTDTK